MGSIIVLLLQMRKMSHREVVWEAWSHTANKVKSWDSNSGQVAWKAHYSHDNTGIAVALGHFLVRLCIRYASALLFSGSQVFSSVNRCQDEYPCLFPLLQSEGLLDSFVFPWAKRFPTASAPHVWSPRCPNFWSETNLKEYSFSY